MLDLATGGDAPESLHAPRAAMEMRACLGADAARRCATGRAARCAQLIARGEQLAAVDGLAARNAHYEVLWDLIVDGADNARYRLALTTLVARQRIASVKADAVAAEAHGRSGHPRARRPDLTSDPDQPTRPPATCSNGSIPTA